MAAMFEDPAVSAFIIRYPARTRYVRTHRSPEGSTLTRTFRITPPTPRSSRLVRAAKVAAAEARGLYFAAAEAKRIYDLETRELATRRLADAMEHATVRVYATIPADDHTADSIDVTL